MAEGDRTSLSLPDEGTALARRDPDLRDHLPGVEPERQLTDWGRS